MTAPSPALMGEIDFLGWLGQAEPGDLIVYHRGLLAADRAHSSELGQLANRAFATAEGGLVDLVQRRHGPDDFTYFAIARQHSVRVSALIGSEAA